MLDLLFGTVLKLQRVFLILVNILQLIRLVIVLNLASHLFYKRRLLNVGRYVFFVWNAVPCLWLGFWFTYCNCWAFRLLISDGLHIIDFGFTGIFCECLWMANKGCFWTEWRNLLSFGGGTCEGRLLGNEFLSLELFEIFYFLLILVIDQQLLFTVEKRIWKGALMLRLAWLGVIFEELVALLWKIFFVIQVRNEVSVFAGKRVLH